MVSIDLCDRGSRFLVAYEVRGSVPSARARPGPWDDRAAADSARARPVGGRRQGAARRRRPRPGVVSRAPSRPGLPPREAADALAGGTATSAAAPVLPAGVE